MEAEARFKAAGTTQEKIAALEEMLAVIPKHKGTDHLRGDLKRRLSQLREEQRTAPKTGRRVDPGYVPSQGAGQVVLLGPANGGKSSLLSVLTRVEPEIASYPYTTRKPKPGMMMFEDVPIQLVDTPAMDRNHFDPWMLTLARNADAALVVLDPGAVGVLDALDVLEEFLTRGRVQLRGAWWALDGSDAETPEDTTDLTGQELDDNELLARLDPGDIDLPLLVVVNKIDAGDNREQLAVLDELFEGAWPLLGVSVETGEGLDQLKEATFRALRVIRVYAKPPGKPPSLHEPIILPAGSTVRDMARSIHKEIAAGLQFARIWSERHYDGQRIPRDHLLQDWDIIEIHT